MRSVVLTFAVVVTVVGAASVMRSNESRARVARSSVESRAFVARHATAKTPADYASAARAAFKLDMAHAQHLGQFGSTVASPVNLSSSRMAVPRQPRGDM